MRSPTDPAHGRCPGELPAGVTELIRRHLHSVLDIETLLLLRSRPAALWSARALAHRAVHHGGGRRASTWPSCTRTACSPTDGGTPAVALSLRRPATRRSPGLSTSWPTAYAQRQGARDRVPLLRSAGQRAQLRQRLPPQAPRAEDDLSGRDDLPAVRSHRAGLRGPAAARVCRAPACACCCGAGSASSP